MSWPIMILADGIYHDDSDLLVTTTAASPCTAGLRQRPTGTNTKLSLFPVPIRTLTVLQNPKIPAPSSAPFAVLIPAMDSDPGPLPPDDGPSNPNANPRPDAEPDPEPKPQEYTEEERLSSLILEESGNAAGARPAASNGSLSADFYSGDEIEEEEPAAASDSVDEVERAAGEARASSLHGGVAWRENLEEDGDAPPSPSSSGYAGERGSSGESGIEEVDDGGASLDAWSHGKEHLDEASSTISAYCSVISEFGLRIPGIQRLL